jgi:C-terminal processing protease CtpA/Prc
MEPAGGVGIAFEDRLDQLSGGMQKIVAEIFTEGAAADWNSTASENQMIHSGDMLMEVNGEKVERISMQMLSTMVPGPVGTPVILRLRSVKRNNEFEVHFFFSAYARSTRKRHRRAACEFS